MADRLRRIVTEDPERVLVIDGENRLSARTLHAQARSLAHALLARVPPGGVVSFTLPNWHEAAVIYNAITLAGLVAHPILPSLRDQELSFMLRDVGSRLIFIPAEFRRHDYVAMLDRVVAALETPPEVVVVRGEARSHTRYEDLLAARPEGELPAVEPDSVRLVMYTSGTTGTSKGVLHTHNTIHALLRQIGRNWLVDPGDSFLVPSPISHIGGSIYAFEAPVLLGTTAVLMERWDPEQALELVIEERCTHLCGATPFLQQFLDAAIGKGERLPGLKLFVCGGASVPPSLVRKAAAHFAKAAVTRVYGSTEVPVITVGCPDRADLAHAADTDGRPGIAEVKLAPAESASPGEGEIVVRGPQMLVGYVRAQDESTVFDAQGYYRTGDLGRWVDGNYLVVSGRVKDIIIRNGENISPKELEDLLVTHPQIAEVAIVGLPDARTGERACAVIVPRVASGLDVAALRTFLAEKGVATFKFPEEVVLWDALPKNDAGKVLKHQIRARLTGAAGSAR
jgi:acyl-CoA synthetase (AMP-forming)/AMP-acid ligase II